MKRRLLLFVCLVMQLAIFANPVEIDLSSGSYTGDFTQGQSYTFTGSKTVTSEWYVAPDFLTRSINDNYVFRASSGVYKITADDTNQALLVDKIWDGDGRIYREEYNPTTDPRGGAIWVVGAYGSIGMPKYTSGNAWDTSNVPNMFCVPRMKDNIFEWTLTVGQELNANQVDFKFRGTHENWNKSFNGTGSGGYKITTTSDIFGIGTGTGEGGNGHDDGNIFLKTGQTLTVGDTYKFRLDCSDAYNIVLTVQKVTVPVSPTPTHVASQVLSVFSDSYTNEAGAQTIKYKQDNADWHVISERSFATDCENKYYDIELNNGWVIMKNATTKDVSNYDYMHIDVYRQYFGGGDNLFYAYPRNVNDKPADGDTEGFTAFQDQQVNAAEGQWVSVNVPLYDKNSTYKGYMEQMEQLLITQAGKGILAVDNIYFWRELTTATLTSTEGTTVYQHINVPLSATFADKDGDPIAISDMDQIIYSKVSGVGSVDASTGVFTSDETGTAVVKVTGVLGTESVEATLTLTVQKIPESTDPTKPGADVHAPYSDSYIKRLYFLDGNVWKDGDAGAVTKHTFDDDSHNHFAIFDNFKHYVTVDLNGVLDVTGYTHLHVDVLQLTGDTNKNLYINPQAGANNPADTRDDNTKLACEKGVWKSFDIDLSKTPFTDITSYKQIAFLSENGNTADESFAIDNVYFWRDQPADPVTTDTDKKGLNWDSTNGTTCYFDRIIWERCNDNTTKKGLGGFAKAHDGNNLTYHTITPEELVSPNQHAQLLLMLTKPIKVSDVELIWANGFPKEYKVYAFEQFPLVDDAVPAELLEEESGNLLFEVDRILTTDPSFETRSNLQNEVEHLSQYILIDMTERGEASTFGYYLAEAHVGAYDATYLTPDHLGIPDYEILTDVDQTLDVTVRNKRNAILEGVTYRQGSVTTTLTSPQLKKRNNQETVLYATSPAEYTIKIDGELSDGTPLNQGTGTITADRRWVKSLVQQVYDKYEGNTAKLNEMFQASRTEGSYSPYKVGDGKEAAQNIYSRWSSFNNYDPDEIPWDGSTEAANRRKEWNKNQYLLINLEKVYEMTHIELIWERAYSPEYTVFGFETEDLPTGEQLNQDYNTFCTNYASHLLYTGTNSAAKISMYPFHDEHTSLTSGTGAIKRNNRTQYLLIKMNEPAQQSGDYFGFSLWEVYAEGADLTITDNVNRLEAPNISVKARHEGVQNITAKGTYGDENIEEEKWHPVKFSTDEEGYATFADSHTDTETGTTLERFYMYKKDNSFDVTDANSLPSEIPAQFLVAIITDNNNGTYGIVAGNNGYGQENGKYHTDNSAYKSFTINMSSTNTKNESITGSFELVIYKDVMKLLSGTSSDKRQVYDDGYFSMDELTKNITAETVSIDLRNVDFTTDNDGVAVNSSSNPILAPHNVVKGKGTGSEVQLNPNTIYYTDETGLVAQGNLAVKQDNGTWKVAMLRIFDGWDWEPIDNEGGMIATKASFYTSIPANHYSFIALPFAPDISYFSGKQVKLYKPTAFRPERNAVKIDEISEFGANEIGHPLVIYTENAANYRENGYALAFTSSGTSTSINYAPGTWSDNGATFISTYTKKNVQDIDDNDTAYDYYMYSIKNDQFLRVGNSGLADDLWNGADNKSEGATHVMPFYCYMKVPVQASPAPAFTFTLIDDTETTGIDAAEAETDGTVKVYDVQGRYVSDSSRNLTPGMYIIKRADGSTRKVYIKK